jgi:2-desacetyl-2-hydroxyethyl bacteriochlorophyllide A dehydrogenase
MMDETHPALPATALWLRAPRAVELRDEQVPAPPHGTIRVRAIASALSHGTELLVYRGEVPADLPLDLPTLAGSFAFPIKYGYAAVGRVLDAGPGVSRFAPGDLVFALHPHQSLFLAPEHLALRLPPDLDPLVGLFTANLETALNILHDTPLRLGETAVVFGQGIVGLLVTQLLRRAGVGRVFAVDPLDRRRALALHVGADAALAPGPELAAHIRERNDGRAADVAIEASGNGAALQAAIDTVMDEGTVVVASWYGVKPVVLNLGGHFHRGRIQLRSSQVGRLNPALAPRWDHARRLATVAGLLPQLRLAELITHRLPFAEAARAYALIDEHPGETGQVVLVYDETPRMEDGG